MSAIEKGQDILFAKMDTMDGKLDKLCLNGAQQNGEAKLQAYKVGLWGWIVRTVSVACITAVVGYFVSLIFHIH